jgi:polyribonucleotide nucleotidyltransferase
MDFKVAGTADAITALQLDTKIEGIPADVLIAALDQAKDARLAILDVMNAALSAPRSEVAETAPKIVSFTIPLDKVGEVIGPKGKVINTIQQETGADIAVSDDGAVGIITIGSPDSVKVNDARERIMAIVQPPTADLGGIYNGRVVSITKFGAFVNILPGRDGLIHISKLGGGKRINNVEDVLSLGQEIEVRVEDIDDKGKVSLTLAGDPPAPAASSSSSAPAPRAATPAVDGPVTVSFDDAFDSEISSEIGDLGPECGAAGEGTTGNDDRRGRGGREHGPRRHR